MRNVRRSIVVALIVLSSFVAASARADVVFSRPPLAGGGVSLSSWVDPEGSDSDIYAYDDFTIPGGATVTEVRWRGGYSLGAPYGHVTDFTVTFFASSVGGTQPLVGNPQLEDTVPTYLSKQRVHGNAGETAVGASGGIMMYDYAFVLTTPFVAAAGTKYWIRIEASEPVYPDWGIAIGTGGDGSHFQFSTGAAMFTYRSNDAAFDLLGTGSAAPTATVTATAAPTATATATAPTPTATAVVPTATATATAIVPTATATALAPTPTPTATATPLAPTPSPSPALDAFACHLAAPSKGAPKAAAASVALVDAFGGAGATVQKPKYLCAPANVAGGDPSAPPHAEHLVARQAKRDAKLAVRPDVLVDDRFDGALHLAVKNLALLLSPAVVATDGTTPPLPASFATDSFACYLATAAKGAPKLAPVAGIAVSDAFGSFTVDVQKPKYVCAPTDVAGESPSAPTHPAWLACYQAKQVDAVKFATQTGVGTNDRFGGMRLDAKKPAIVCVPALVTP